MTQEFVTLPREVVEQAMEFSEYHSKYWLGVGTHPQGFVPALRSALDQPQNHVPDAGNMVPAGWKLVPVDPTDDMLYDIQEFSHILPPRGKRIWAHMLAAAPQPPVVEQQQVEQEPVAWMVTSEMQDGTRSTYPMIGRFKDVQDCCDFGEPVPLIYQHPQPKREPLTDEEIDKLCPQFDDPMRREMWIIGFKAAHNIK